MLCFSVLQCPSAWALERAGFFLGGPMPYRKEYEPDGLGVILAFSGLVEGDELYLVHRQLMQEEGFSQWCYQIWDFSLATAFAVTVDHLRKFAFQNSLASEVNPRQKIAIIRRRQGPRTGLDELFHLFEEEWGAYPSKTFSKIAEARKWAKGDGDTG